MPINILYGKKRCCGWFLRKDAIVEGNCMKETHERCPERSYGKLPNLEQSAWAALWSGRTAGLVMGSPIPVPGLQAVFSQNEKKTKKDFKLKMVHTKERTG